MASKNTELFIRLVFKDFFVVFSRSHEQNTGNPHYTDVMMVA